jgi:hypothetical protein
MHKVQTLFCALDMYAKLFHPFFFIRFFVPFSIIFYFFSLLPYYIFGLSGPDERFANI